MNYFYLVNELGNVTINNQSNIIDCIQLNVSIKNEIVKGKPNNTNYAINVYKNEVPFLLNELRAIKSTIEKLDYQQKYNTCD